MFLGRDIMTERDFSEHTASVIDEEIRELIEKAYALSKSVLLSHRNLMDRVTEVLVQKETVDAEELEQLIETSLNKAAA